MRLKKVNKTALAFKDLSINNYAIVVATHKLNKIIK